MDKLIGESPVMQVVLRPAEPAFGEHQHSYSQNYPFYAIVKNYVFLLQNFANTRSLKKLSAVPCHPGHSDCTPNEI